MALKETGKNNFQEKKSVSSVLYLQNHKRVNKKKKKKVNIQSQHNKDPKENFEEKLLFYLSN